MNVFFKTKGKTWRSEYISTSQRYRVASCYDRCFYGDSGTAEMHMGGVSAAHCVTLEDKAFCDTPAPIYCATDWNRRRAAAGTITSRWLHKPAATATRCNTFLQRRLVHTLQSRPILITREIDYGARSGEDRNLGVSGEVRKWERGGGGGVGRLHARLNMQWKWLRLSPWDGLRIARHQINLMTSCHSEIAGVARTTCPAVICGLARSGRRYIFQPAWLLYCQQVPVHGITQGSNHRDGRTGGR